MPRYLGQHFLKNKTILSKIAQAVEIKNGEIIVEIGPGHGELTEEIIKFAEGKDVKIIVIEKDGRLIDGLKEKFSGDKNIEIIYGDVLEILPILHTKYQIQNTKYKLVGNIPYYITGHLLRIIGELKIKPIKTILLIQKEVAQRICAKAPDSSLLSMSVGFWAEPKIIISVASGNFAPSPEVESAVLELDLKDDVNWNNADKYYSFIKKAFKQPRKTLVNNLIFGGYNKDTIASVFKEHSLNKNIRPQDMTQQDAYQISLLF